MSSCFNYYRKVGGYKWHWACVSNGIVRHVPGDVLFFCEYGLIAANIQASNDSMFTDESVKGSVRSHQFVLGEIDSKQEVSKTDLPASTQELYYKQGLLYFKIKDINDMAQEAFIDDQVQARNFSMKILNRGGGTRKVVESV